MLEKAINLCFPQAGDQIPRGASLLTFRSVYEPDLKSWPVIKHPLGSQHMIDRGRKTKGHLRTALCDAGPRHQQLPVFDANSNTSAATAIDRN